MAEQNMSPVLDINAILREASAAQQSTAQRSYQDLLEIRRSESDVAQSERAVFEALLESRDRPYAGFLFDAGLTYGLSPVLLWAVMNIESGGVRGERSTAVSPKNAKGLMQIHDSPNAEAEWFKTVGDKWKDPKTNIFKGADMLASKYKFFRSKDMSKEVLGSLPDPRPLTGFRLTLAAVAAYNAGEGRVLRALARGQDPDSVTDHNNYARSVLKQTTQKAIALGKKGSTLASPTNAVALVIGSPVATEPVQDVFKKSYYGLKAFARNEKMLATPRSVFVALAAAQDLQQAVSCGVEGNAAKEALPIAADLTNPGFVEDGNLAGASYDYVKGTWGDGAMT
jgi:hypothetical protein